MLRLATKFGAFAIALLLFTAPSVACLLPIGEMTQAERECCKHMAEQCGGAAMPSSHSCCQRVSDPDVSSFVVPQSQQQVSHLTLIAVHNPAVGAVSTVGERVARADWFDGIHGPPESPPASTPILRI